MYEAASQNTTVSLITVSSSTRLKAGNAGCSFSFFVPVGQKTADEVRERVLAKLETLKVGVSTDPAAQYGPVVSQAHRDKIAGAPAGTGRRL